MCGVLSTGYLTGCAQDTSREVSSIGCEAMEEEAMSLLTGFGRCRVDSDCALFSLSDHLEPRRKRCPRAFLCLVPVRADSDRSELVATANSFLKKPSPCEVCIIAKCAGPESVEAYCDAGRGACALRRRPPS